MGNKVGKISLLAAIGGLEICNCSIRSKPCFKTASSNPNKAAQ